jgi:hypothetical protein
MVQDNNGYKTLVCIPEIKTLLGIVSHEWDCDVELWESGSWLHVVDDTSMKHVIKPSSFMNHDDELLHQLATVSF